MNFNLVNQAMANYLGLSIIILSILLVISLILNLVAMKRIKSQQKQFQAMLNGTNGDNIQQELIKNQQLLQQVLKDHGQLKELEEKNQLLFNSSLQRMALHRFTAFDNMGGDTSYALALLDNNLDGVILSSIHSRQECRSYAKPIVKGKSSYQLSQEEELVLQQACQNK